MKANLEISIKNIGETPGSVGWFATVPKSAVFGITKEGAYRGCWLTIDGKKELVLSEGAAFSSFYGCLPMEGVHTNLSRDVCPEAGLDSPDFGVQWTDAGWASLNALVDQLRELFEQWLQDSGAVEFTVTAAE